MARETTHQGGEGRAGARPLICGIGASAGGLSALRAFFAALPPHTGVVYVVVVHLAPAEPSELPELLALDTSMPVRGVGDGAELAVDHVYVVSPGVSLEITEAALVGHPLPAGSHGRAMIDAFFHNLAAVHPGAIAVVLSGCGADGAAGIREIHERGGVVLVQDPREAEYDSMPRSAIATGLADAILPVAGLAARVAAHARAAREAPPPPAPSAQDDGGDEETLARILALLRVQVGHDFAAYKRSTLRRRIARRMQENGLQRLREYLEVLRGNAVESQALFDDLLISVTAFFRDPAAFEALQGQVIPDLFERSPKGGVRVWVPGCATGEEVYSLVILLLEEAARRGVPPDFHVFGSDLDDEALTSARAGRYPAAIEAAVSEARLRRFFVRENGLYRVSPEVRDHALFASHSLLKDPPFLRLDLISCRNLLIYLERDLQKQVLAIFRYALRPRGYLFLGLSESAEGDGLFRTVDKEHRIFQVIERSHQQPPLQPPLMTTAPRLRSSNQAAAGRPSPATEAILHHRALEAMAPPSVLVDERGDAVHLSETAGLYLQHPGGRPTSDVTALIRPELRPELRTALFRAFERGESTLTRPVPVRFNGLVQQIQLLVRRQRPQEGESPLALVMFIEGDVVPEDEVHEPGVDASAPDEAVARLRDELRLTQQQLTAAREDHEVTVEELRATNEELRAANEELHSINEEYRATTEELETSKEELHSINEELRTVNGELKGKLDEVSRAHSDLQNLITATDVGTLFLDCELRIKRFTPRVGDLFNVTPGDVGREVSDFTHRLDYDGLVADAGIVLADLVPVEREVRSKTGRWYLIRLRPYRTVDNKIDGVVASFVDVTERRATEEALRESEQRRLVAVEAAGVGDWTFDVRRGVMTWSERALAIQRRGAGERPTLNDHVARVHPEDRARLNAAMAAAIDPAGDGRFHAQYRYCAGDDEVRWIDSMGQAHFEVTPAGRRAALVLGAMRDISEDKEAERQRERLLGELRRLNETLEERVAERTQLLTLSEERNRALVEATTQTVWAADGLGCAIDDAPGWRQVTGQTRESWRSAGWLGAVHPDDRAAADRAWAGALAAEAHLEIELRLADAGGGWRWSIVRAAPLRRADGALHGWVGASTDISARKQAEQERDGLVQRVLMVQEEERRRISRELHDQVGQDVTALVLGLTRLAEQAGGAPAADELGGLREIAVEIGKKTHDLALELRPTALDDLGLVAAVEHYLEKWGERAGIEVDFHCVGFDDERLPPAVETAVYRVVQETLTNVVRHADASSVALVLERRPQLLVAVVEDDGRGFDTAAPPQCGGRTHLGIVGMRERIAQVGGTLSIESAPGSGTSVFIRIPLAAPASGAGAGAPAAPSPA